MNQRALVPPCVKHSLCLSQRLLAPAFLCLTCVHGVPALAQTLGTPTITVKINGPVSTRLGLSGQFTAVVLNNSNQSVLWQVNGITGGAAASGTITPAGLFTAPTSLPTPNPVTISAISVSTPTATASMADQIFNPYPAITSANATPNASSGNYLLDVQGSGYISGSQLQVSSGTVGATTYISPTELTASFTLPAGAATVLADGTPAVSVDVLNPNPGTVSSRLAGVRVSTISYATASRFLDQATFGPTAADIQHVQTVGLRNYLAEQFTATPTLFTPFSASPPVECALNPARCLQSEWWNAALAAPDQVRQRIAFALSEIFVVSSDDFNASIAVPYQNTLATDAFGNFQKLLYDVTLSPAMGLYLDMLNNAAPINGQHPDENYAREVMQLFTIGINPLAIDGKPDLNALTYKESDVQQFALAYTGWTYAKADGTPPSRFPNPVPNYTSPMAPVEAYHDMTQKTLLDNITLPAGQTAETDLAGTSGTFAGALGDLFNHPNVAPFICRQLIQHLVEGNPSPRYVQRIALVFNNDGTGVRGNLQAVVQAILLDPEARAGDTAPVTTGGHLREPVLYVANVMRALGFVNTLPDNYAGYVSNLTLPLAQAPYASPNVFNFFHPNYVIPATILSGSVNSPEFGIENTGSTIARISTADILASNSVPGFSVDLSATSPLGLLATGADTGPFVDQLGSIFMHGQMPSEMRAVLVPYLNSLATPAERVQSGVFLVISSSQYKIMQ